MYLQRSHASLPSQPVNRAVQYLRRLSQDPPGQSVNQFSYLNLNLHELYVFLLLVIHCCNKASNRIVPKQKDLVSSSG